MTDPQQTAAHERRIAELEDERERLYHWIDDLQSNMYINCVYCGHRYGPDDEVPATMAQILKEHVERCPKHPMSTLKRQLADATERAELAEADNAALIAAAQTFRNDPGKLDSCLAAAHPGDAMLDRLRSLEQFVDQGGVERDRERLRAELATANQVIADLHEQIRALNGEVATEMETGDEHEAEAHELWSELMAARARIRELEAALPDPNILRIAASIIRRGDDPGDYAKALVGAADSIDAVMGRKQP